MNTKVIVDKPGAIDVLNLVDELEPVPNKGEVKVRILASGVAFGDVMLRLGIGTPASAYPLTPGYDVVGVVEAVGPGAVKYNVGDRVAGLPGKDGYQQFICLPEHELIPVPQGLEPDEVVSVILNYTTAYQLLTRVAHLKAGDKALIHGAAGGVGTAMLQLAQLMGINMYGTASTGKLELVEQLGGVPLDYQRTDFVKELLEMQPTGVQAVFDPIGGAQLSRSYKVLAKKGTLVMFNVAAASQGRNPTLALVASVARLFWLKLRPDTRHAETYLIEAAKRKRPEQFHSDVGALLDLLKEDKIKPQIAQVLPLSEVRKAHELLQNAKVTGKIVLRP